MPDLQQYPWNLNLLKNEKDIVVFLTRNVFIFWVSPLLLKIKKCASRFRKETATENKQFKENKNMISYLLLIGQWFQGYHCKSGIVIFSWRVTDNYASSPFKFYLPESIIRWGVAICFTASVTWNIKKRSA